MTLETARNRPFRREIIVDNFRIFSPKHAEEEIGFSDNIVRVDIVISIS